MSDFMMTRFQPTWAPTKRANASFKAAGRVSERHPVAWLRLVFRTWLTRRALLTLSARELADIGVSPETARAEATRLPWDITSAL